MKVHYFFGSKGFNIESEILQFNRNYIDCPMSVHLQVCIRCRPFAHEDKLGLIMKEEEDGNSSIELLDQNGTPHSRRGFAKSWWSAYNCRF